jgi:hypothetical protein
MDMEKQWFDCACAWPEHTLRFVYDPDEGDLWTEVHLTHDVWWKRLWTAVRHVFGYKCKYGCYDCWLMKDEDVDRLIDLLQRKKERMKNVDVEKSSGPCVKQSDSD